MIPERSTLIGGRLDFALVANDRGYKIAVEVGVDRGVYARQFLDRWSGEMYYGVDPYSPYTEMPWDRQSDLAQALQHLQPHLARFRMLLSGSYLAALRLREGGIYPHFVYIDGDHSYQSTKEDMTIWWEMLVPGGLLAGDDFDPGHTGVMRAVADFVLGTDRVVQLTTDYNRPPSWFIEKPTV